MKTVSLATLVLLLSWSLSFSQNEYNAFVVVSYNVENLFDTVNSPLFEDDEFTPSGSKRWTADRYEKKLDDLARVILSVPGKELPGLVGLAEVENRKVLEDLVERQELRPGQYRIVHEEGVDPRGIECALLYRPSLFRYLSHEYIPIRDTVDPEYLYRGILHVTGTGPDGSNLQIYVNHWKSRSGGALETERQRFLYAITLKEHLELMQSREPGSKVIIMGDFNDEPTNRSVIDGLSALNKRRNMQPGELYNLFYDLHNLKGEGTYNFRGTWNMLDQVMVSYNLLNQAEGLSTGYDRGHILKEEWMLFDSERYGQKLPSSTYGGPEYYGGPSDHLPIYVDFKW